MRSGNESTLKQAIHALIRSLGHEEKMQEIMIVNKWSSIVGEMIDKRTTNIKLKNNELIVRFKSPEVKNEVLYQQSQIIKEVNELLGEERVTKLSIY